MSENAQSILELGDEENHLQIDEHAENKISNTIEEKHICKMDVDVKDINEIKILENQQTPELVQFNTNLIEDKSSFKQSDLSCNIAQESINKITENEQNMECKNMKDQQNIEIIKIENEQNIEIVIKNKQNIEIDKIVDNQNIKPIDKQTIESVNIEEEMLDHQNNIEIKMSSNEQEMEKIEIISEIDVVNQQLINKTIENQQIIASVNEETFSTNQTNEINNSLKRKIENESEAQISNENQHSATEVIDIQNDELINAKTQINNFEENKQIESQTYREIESVYCVSSDSELDSDSTSVSSLSPAEMDLDNKDKSNNKECEENKDIVAPSPSVPKPPPKVRRPHKWDILTEGDLPSIQDLQINVKEEEAKVIGAVSQIVKNQVVVESIPGLPAIDLNSVLFVDKGRRALGHVFDVFGAIEIPNYMVRFNSADHVTERGISVGDDVYFAPQTSHTNYVHIAQLMNDRGSDASWVGNMAVPTSLQEYSDDEEERTVKRNKKKTKETFQPNSDIEARSKRVQHNPFRAPQQPPHRNQNFDSRRDNSRRDFSRDSPSPWMTSSPCPSPSPSNTSSFDWLSWTPPSVLRSSPRPSTAFGCQQSPSPRPPFTSSPFRPNAPPSPFRGGPPPFEYPPANLGPYQVNQPPRDSNAPPLYTNVHPPLYTNVPPPIRPSFGVNSPMNHFNGPHAGGFNGGLPVPVFGMNILPPQCPPNILPPNVASQPTHRPSNIVVVNTAVPPPAFPPTFSREQNTTFRNGSFPFSNGGNNGPPSFGNGGNNGPPSFGNGGNNGPPLFSNGGNNSTQFFNNGSSFANGGNISAPPSLNPMWRPPNSGPFNPPR